MARVRRSYHSFKFIVCIYYLRPFSVDSVLQEEMRLPKLQEDVTSQEDDSLKRPPKRPQRSKRWLHEEQEELHEIGRTPYEKREESIEKKLPWRNSDFVSSCGKLHCCCGPT